MRFVIYALALSCLAIGGWGCRSESETSQPLQPEDYGKLSGLSNSPSPKLRDELARIVEEKGTPGLLSKTTPAAKGNVAAGLRGLFPENKIASILKESEDLFPPGQFQFDPFRLQRAIGFRKKYDYQSRRAREALKRSYCNFGIPFMDGFLADLKFIDVVRICARLEAFRAAESLSDDNLDEAIESWRLIFRLASCLAAEKHSQTRAQAAFVRTEGFVVLQAIVRHREITRRNLEMLHKTVENQLKDWPSDANAVIGDRALGMHAYEMVRNGDLIALLTDKEIEVIVEEGGVENFLAAAKRNVDRDELYFLQTMRKIIDRCQRPYFERVDLFSTIRDDLQAKRNLPEFPIVAARLLLPDIQKGQKMQAQDRANWEAWAVALAAALGHESPPYSVNPLTAGRYACKMDVNYVEVGNFGTGIGNDDPAIFVPYLGGTR